jgi:hypothetical protein
MISSDLLSLSALIFEKPSTHFITALGFNVRPLPVATPPLPLLQSHANEGNREGRILFWPPSIDWLEESFGGAQIFSDELTLARYCQKARPRPRINQTDRRYHAQSPDQLMAAMHAA